MVERSRRRLRSGRASLQGHGPRSTFRRAVARLLIVEVRADQHTLAAPLAALNRIARERASQLELSRISDVSAAYSTYTRLFDSFEQREPTIAAELYRSTRDEFEEMVAHGKSFLAYLGNAQVGLVAATRGPLWGQSGWVMHEEFLGREFRGKGLGLDLQRALVAQLDARDGLLWGTIHATNEPSLRTALKNGRQIVQTHYFLGHD